MNAEGFHNKGVVKIITIELIGAIRCTKNLNICYTGFLKINRVNNPDLRVLSPSGNPQSFPPDFPPLPGLE